ncbi:MAG: hypothetical protein L0I80_07310 [Brevibacterium sp.]|uniref:hypothetical protein n=1 Tax=Brevibacterium sp. TaxID=1701 RepID=UPI0026485FC2|nr:hypothetical protein [Brevibacterium sp.]MDN5808379.1 hypothetical protein [Brevibacterium sp.]MDN5834058.1 hypothetical protein [Brevibacterium sp.]MDN5876495.1 hypothetical protein [Brevibacterium sp.]MDN5908670.1 hypothetical protein [Brevibacterium sp.]MDN6123666.1 hypothetical protein [Brevibacterium sp.]
MTWAKYGTEYFDKLVAMLVDAGVSEALEDACVRTAAEVHHYCFSRLSMSAVQQDAISIQKRFLAHACSSPLRDDAAKELVRSGVWRDTGNGYEVVHGRFDIKSGITSQEVRRGNNRKSQQTARDKKRAKAAKENS